MVAKIKSIILNCTLVAASCPLPAGEGLEFGNGFESPPPEPCAMQVVDIEMLWNSCAPGIDCYEDSGDFFLRLPTEGPVVRNAHLVTDADAFGGGWPSSVFDGFFRHQQISQVNTGLGAELEEGWLPAGEGGSEWGQGATGAYVPNFDENYHITMFWANRPSIGTRMIVRNPVSGEVVVASAGLNTAPMANSRIAGVSEEIHEFLGTDHLDDLQIGFAVDQTLPLGPTNCE